MNVYTFLKITNMNMNILDYDNKQIFFLSTISKLLAENVTKFLFKGSI